MSFTQEALDSYLDLHDDCLVLLSLYQAVETRQASKKVPQVKTEQAALRLRYEQQIERVVAGLIDAYLNDVPNDNIELLLNRVLPAKLLTVVREKLEANQ